MGTVIEAGDGEEALHLARAQRLDAVILDLSMPGMGGLSLLRALHALPAPTRIVVLTNHAEERYRAECLRLGADAFLDKSKDLDRLVEAATQGTSRPS